MGILDKVKAEKEKKLETPQRESVKIDNSNLNLSVDELEFIIRMIGSSNFKGNNLMFIYDLVKKLQDEYLRKSGGSK